MQIEERSLEHSNTATQPRWTACLAMLIAWLTRLFDHITRMKRVRRTTRFKLNWRDHWAGLRQSEWLRDQTLAYGAAQLLAGKPVTLAFTPILDPPAGYGGPCPTSPFEMNRRFLALAQWLADPEPAILRHAQRIAKREGIALGGCPLRHASHATSPTLRAEEKKACALSSSSAQHWGRWIAASSRRDGGGSRNRARAPPLRGPPLIFPKISPTHLESPPLPGSRPRA